MARVQQWVREFTEDPLGKSIEAAVYLFMLAIGLSILVYVGKWAFEMVRNAAS